MTICLFQQLPNIPSLLIIYFSDLNFISITPSCHSKFSLNMKLKYIIWLFNVKFVLNMNLLFFGWYKLWAPITLVYLVGENILLDIKPNSSRKTNPELCKKLLHTTVFLLYNNFTVWFSLYYLFLHLLYFDRITKPHDKIPTPDPTSEWDVPD